jgi:DNA polymerase elongation subunit (family B)
LLNHRFNIYTDYQQDQSIFASIGNIITQNSHQTVVIHTRDTIEDIYLVELIEKSRFSYLTLKLASEYEMLRLIDNCITFVVGLDKAGMIISHEIGLHENVAVLDFNDEYANIITRRFIDNLPSDEDKVVLTLVQQFLEIPLNCFLFILIQPDI